MGSNFWLATTVLCSSTFAFLFGLTVTTKMGVPLNVVLLSEGLPFLVVTVGFDKPIVLTKAVLSASLKAKQQSASAAAASHGGSKGEAYSPMTIQSAVQAAVRDKGFEIVRDYFIEILVLVAGAASGVQGGLRPFCFLAAWILFFDCILLFTFYTAILSVKLEITRIKRHMALRKALEEDGVSRRVAENVARSNDWPKLNDEKYNKSSYSKGQQLVLFGRNLGDISVSKFKVLMVSGFFIVNIINLSTIPFRSGHISAESAAPSPSGIVGEPPIDPFEVASKGLESIYASAVQSGASTIVTVLAPIQYMLDNPSVYHVSDSGSGRDYVCSSPGAHTDQLFDGASTTVVDSLLKSLEDPVLSKWIILALAISLVLNGYLFNAARWSIKDAHSSDGLHNEDAVGKELRSVVRASSTHETEIEQTVVSKKNAIQKGSAQKDYVEEDGITMKGTKSPTPVQSSTRTKSECESLVLQKRAAELTDGELVDLALRGKIAAHALEKTLGDPARAVIIRRSMVSRTPATSAITGLLESSLLPHASYDYAQVQGACCENVIGYMPIPVGVAGPVVIDGQSYFLPMATTEGVLVASTSRGCKAINAGGGAVTVITGDGMTRGPCISFETLQRAGAAKIWLDSEAGQRTMKRAFDSTSRFARLQSMKTALAGTHLYIRFKTTTGDAMGMNMISKGVEHALDVMARESGFDDMSIVSVSGNFCTDKKPAAINWIDGRGKSVVAEAIIPGDVVKTVLKSSVEALVELNVSKNLVGSAMAGSIGGFNAHAANIVTAIFLATGQDPAQNVESSNCITLMKK